MVNGMVTGAVSHAGWHANADKDLATDAGSPTKSEF